MLGYILEWLILIVLVMFVCKLFGRSFDKEDVYLFTAIWGIANLCISLEH